MPTADRLAADGLRYTRFHVTALCSPTRQALMTGRNHHSVGMGGTTEMATVRARLHRLPPAQRRDDRPDPAGQRLLDRRVRQVAPDPAVGDQPRSGPFDRWPTGEGFDHFYGFMGAR